MSSSNFSCAACKYKRRKCRKECVFAPYFPSDQPRKFESVHRIFGACNVARILNDLPATQRERAVICLVYEAEARLKDPVYGCVASISILRQRLKQVQTELDTAKQELATYKGPPVLNPGFMPQFPNQQPSVVPIISSNLERMSGLNQPVSSGDAQHGHQLYEAQRHRSVVAAREQHGILRNLELLRFNRRFDGAGPSGQATQPTQLRGPGAMLLSFDSFASGGSHESNVCLNQQQEELCDHILQQLITHEHEPMLEQQNQPSQPQPNDGAGSEEGRSVGPSR